jgi:hypothetical protein
MSPSTSLAARSSLPGAAVALRSTLGAIAYLLSTAAIAQAQTTPLDSSDFTVVLSRIDPSSGSFVPLDSTASAAFFSAARCACPTNVGVSVMLGSDGVAKLVSGDSLDVTVMIGSDCDNVSSTTCTTLGTSLTLDATTTSSGETIASADVFSTIAPGKACTALPSTSSRLWAIVRLNGTRIATQPSINISLGGAGPGPPTAVATQTADSGLLVSWTERADTSTVQGYQVLCSPGPAAPIAAAYDSCAAALTPRGTGPFDALDATLICSSLVTVGTASVRVKGLSNGTAYQVAVLAIGIDGTPSAASAIAEGVPGPTLGFDDIYKESGGTGLGGCAIAGSASARGARDMATASVLLVGAALASRRRRPQRRRRRRRWPAAIAIALTTATAVGLTFARAATARAAFGDGDGASDGAGDGDGAGDDGRSARFLLGGGPARPMASPRTWNLEIGAGPYYPDVDSEFADRGQTVRPFQQIFSSAQRAKLALELDRHLSHRGGTWAVGFGFGYYRAQAASLAADHLTRTGDETSFRFFPLSLRAIYRADLLRERFRSPVVPYAKLGLDCALWSTSDTAKSGATTGQTLGWDAAAGISFDLSFLDPEAARTMDLESGVNQFALFFEVAHDALDGFGSSSVLRLGDTTWIAGLMLEM